MPHVPLHLVLLGPPAAGKGTQAVLIAKKYGCVPVSTGDLMRNMKKGSPHAEVCTVRMQRGGGGRCGACYHIMYMYVCVDVFNKKIDMF